MGVYHIPFEYQVCFLQLLLKFISYPRKTLKLQISWMVKESLKRLFAFDVTSLDLFLFSSTFMCLDLCLDHLYLYSFTAALLTCYSFLLFIVCKIPQVTPFPLEIKSTLILELSLTHSLCNQQLRRSLPLSSGFFFSS